MVNLKGPKFMCMIMIKKIDSDHYIRSVLIWALHNVITITRYIFIDTFNLSCCVCVDRFHTNMFLY